MKVRQALLALSFFAGLVATVYAADMIENPEYKMWSGFKAGSWVKMETTGASKSTMTTKLTAITADEATIETTMEMVIQGMKDPYKNTMPPRKIPAKVEKPKDAPAATEKPKEGDEEIEVGGKKLKCHFYEGKDYKTWTSTEIPGGSAKTKTATTETTAVAWEKK